MQRASPQLHPHQITGLQTKRCISAVGEDPALAAGLEPHLNEVARNVAGVARV